MKRIKRYLLVAIICISLGAGGVIYFNSVKTKQVFASNVTFLGLQMPNYEDILKKVTISDVLVEKITNKKELITMETNLTEKIVWDDSFTNLDIFKKVQRIEYNAIGKYSTDLSQLTQDDISLDFQGKSIFITVPRPTVSSLEILENETKSYNTDNGLLRFGEIKLTVAESNELSIRAKENMLKKLESSDMLKQAEQKTIESVTELVNTFLSNEDDNNFKIKIFFK